MYVPFKMRLLNFCVYLDSIEVIRIGIFLNDNAQSFSYDSESCNFTLNFRILQFYFKILFPN